MLGLAGVQTTPILPSAELAASLTSLSALGHALASLAESAVLLENSLDYVP